MYEDYCVKLAHIITEYSQPIEPGETVAIQASTISEELVRALYEAILRCGGIPVPMVQVEGLGDLFFELANDDQLRYISPLTEWTYTDADAIYTIMAEVNPKAASAHDPAKHATMREAGGHLMQRFIQRIGDGSVKWVGMPYPTHAMAQEAETSLLAYTKFVYEACCFHLDDPIAHWRTVSEEQDRLVEILNTKSELKVIGPDIDLTLNVGGRSWVNCDGKLNFPDGEIFTGPVENSVNGYVNFNLRTMYGGREVNGARLVYQDGKIVEASAAKGEAWLLSQLETDEGARRMGEFAIGTNYSIKEVTGNTLFDEKIGGTIHMAVGHSLPQSGGVNESKIHWDMVHDMAQSEIYADGELFYQHGQFVIDY